MTGFDLSKLNPEQREAVAHGDGPMLILAGAGTGKTRVITARIVRLIDSGADPASILAVTFTNKAANEMLERLGGMLPKEHVRKLTISTFHAFCVRILRADIEKIGYKGNFTIYDENDSTGLLKKIAGNTAAKGERIDVRYIKSMFSDAKNKGNVPPPSERDLAWEVYTRYEREMKNLNAVDFDDLLNLAVRLLADHDDVRGRLQRRYRNLLVDEFQDTNGQQLRLLRLLTPNPPNVCVVGDDDQSIYGWRGAEVSNILEFERHFPNPKVIRLEQNYRSTEAVLFTANGLIRHNPRRRPKNLWSKNGEGEKIRVVTAVDEREESRLVADQLITLKKKGAKWEDMAVLFRMNLQARFFEEEFRRHRIPYRIIGAKSFFDKREVKDLLAWLNTVQNPADDISLLRALTAPARGIGEVTVDRALEQSVSKRCSVFEILENPIFRESLSTRASEILTEFTSLVSTWQSRIAGALPPHIGLVRELLEQIGFSEYLKKSSNSEKEADARAESVGLLLGTMEDKGLSVRDFLDEVTLDRDFGDEKDKTDSGVTLITLHAAKGLEFPHVFLVGLEEGLLPHSKSKMENRIDEERRLLYVGITRAMRTLMISWCMARMRYGKPSPCHPSSFLKQLDDKFVERTDARTLLNRPAEREEMADNFRQLRAALSASSESAESV